MVNEHAQDPQVITQNLQQVRGLDPSKAAFEVRLSQQCNKVVSFQRPRQS